MKTLLYFLLFLGFELALSQERFIEGMVVDAETREPIAYAAIGIEDSNVGTVSDEAGYFRLAIPLRFMEDSLTFSEVVHVRKKLCIESLMNSQEIIIALEEAVLQLKTVEIVAVKERNRCEKLGVKPRFYWGSCYANFKGGAQIAQLIEASTYPVYLTTAKIKIGDNTLKKSIMRVRVLDITSEGLPGEDVFEGIYRDIAHREGWVEINLSRENLVFNKDFFVCFEFLNLQWKQTEGYFSIVCSETNEFSKKQFVRSASLGKWQYALPVQNHTYAVGAEVCSMK